jgi:hypothetical protein
MGPRQVSLDAKHVKGSARRAGALRALVIACAVHESGGIRQVISVWTSGSEVGFNVRSR